MKLCRFNENHLGLVEGEDVFDVTGGLDAIGPLTWPLPQHDPVIANLSAVLERAAALKADAKVQKLNALSLASPVANPSKIIGAPVNYRDHLEEARTEKDIHHGQTVHKIDTAGLFLKAVSALIGPSGTLSVDYGDRRVDHEAEIAVIISKPARRVRAKAAFDYVAGYALALDMTVRGTQGRSMRKSCDGFAVLGPYLTTPDEISDPNDIAFELSVNGNVRQAASTALLIRSIPELIEMASDYYTLLPGDVILTGTPAGVGPVVPGDRICVTSRELGMLEITVQG